LPIFTKTVGGISTRYLQTGKGVPLLVMHGWGSRIENWQETTTLLEKTGMEIILPDLPGFGETAEPPTEWSVGDYVQWVKAFTESVGLTRYHLLGHSFGGRIGIKLAAEDNTPVDKLVLCAAAGVSRPSGLQQLKRTVFRLLSKVGGGLTGNDGFLRKIWYCLVGERDYYRASPAMRRTMARVLAEDLTPLLGRIATPTLVVWGEQDRATPLADGQRIAEGVTGAELRIFPGVRHGVHREAPEKLAELVGAFVQKNS